MLGEYLEQGQGNAKNLNSYVAIKIAVSQKYN